MTKVKGSLRRGDTRGAFDRFYRGAEQVMEAAALVATDRGGRAAKRELRGAFSGARLGRLGNAIGSTSDLEQGRGVHRRGNGSFSASATLYLRSRSDRTIGAIEAYTQGADILPVRSRWLWIPTKEAPQRIGRKRITPALYIAAGSPLGPLITIKSINGRPLLAVQDVGKSVVGARGGRVRSLTKSGRPRKGDRAKALSVLFVGIPNTSRAARVDVSAIAERQAAQMPEYWRQEMKKRGAR